jgi:GNAT superfamily N-acetyltransferase
VKVIRYFLVAQPIRDRPFLPRRGTGGIEVRLVTPDAYDDAWFPRPRTTINARFAQGARCFCAFNNGEPVGCIWLLAGAYLEDEVRCCFVPLPKGKAMWDFDVYVDPAHRGGRLFAYLWDAANQWARGQGISWTMSRINAFNLQSIAAHRRLGATLVGTATFVSFRRLQVALLPSWPYLHVSRVGRPSISVAPPGMSEWISPTPRYDDTTPT